jgi:hypothetical protein
LNNWYTEVERRNPMVDPAPYRENAGEPVTPPKRPSPAVPLVLGLIATAIIPINFWILCAWGWWQTSYLILFIFLALLQLVLGAASCFTALRRSRSALTVVGCLFAALVGLGGPLGIFLVWGTSDINVMGSSWGRPLRLRGRVLHPSLRAGADWTRGASPDASSVDVSTRAALEALWLHDAQKEHASVPALARVSWLLAAVGAPADLVEAVHVAALEEIEHARLCFALAAGYGGRSHTVKPMPELLVGGLDLDGNPLERLAVESLGDGCLLEDFNADVARTCARTCRDRATRTVLERIAREERSHADLSWRLLEFSLERGGPRVARAVAMALARLDRTPRPTAHSSATSGLAARADADAMRAHGRIPDAEWGALWTRRLAETEKRVEAMLGVAGRGGGVERAAS